mgnify:CR=1 FL=1
METKKVSKGIGNVTQLIAKLGAASLDEYENVQNSNLKFLTYYVQKLQKSDIYCFQPVLHSRSLK